VRYFLGHRKLESTEICINIEHTLFEAGANDEFTVKVIEKPEEIKAPLEVGLERARVFRFSLGEILRSIYK
jgi:hypothetical protein